MKKIYYKNKKFGLQPDDCEETKKEPQIQKIYKKKKDKSID